MLLVLLAVALWLQCAVAASTDDRLTMRVEFLDNGQCTVSIIEKANLQSVSVPLSQPANGSDSEYRCPVSWRSRGRAVALAVLLPAGESPAGADFPRLTWMAENGRWVGTATLPAGPAFIRVARAGSRAVGRARLLDRAALAATAVAIVWAIVYSVRTGRAGDA